MTGLDYGWIHVFLLQIEKPILPDTHTHNIHILVGKMND